MKNIRQAYRLLYIQYLLAKNGLDQILVSISYFSAFRFIVYLNPWNWFTRDPNTRSRALRQTLETLGPLFVKFGQALSTRPDILPVDMALELSKLQDNVPAFSSEMVLEILLNAYGRPASSVFAEFNETPLAAASIAQVHAAKLHDGTDVVVKILRPNIRKIIKQDLQLLFTMANWAEKYWAASRRYKPVEVVREFEKNLLAELDMRREAANASQLRRNFKDSPLLYIPEVQWDYVRDNVLVIERIYGIPVADIAQLKALGFDLKKLATRGVEIFFTQVFRDCFFHADMHPGNIFVSTAHPENPQYMCVDFGIMGTLTSKDQRYLAENLLAFFNQDYSRVAELHIESEWVSRNTRQDEFASAIRTVFEPVFEKPLKDISFAVLILNLLQVARDFNMELQPQLVLLQKTLFNIEGLGRQIYPDLDLWSTAKPFLEHWLRQQMSPKKLVANIKANIPFIVEQLPHMPKLIHDVLRLSNERLLAGSHPRKPQKPHSNRWLSGFVFGLLVMGAIIYGAQFIAFPAHNARLLDLK